MPSPSALNALLNAFRAAWPSLAAWLQTQVVAADPAHRQRLLALLRWTRDPQSQRAFAEAAGEAIEAYRLANAGRRAPRFVAKALADVLISPLHPGDPQQALLPALDLAVPLVGLRPKVVARLPGKVRLRPETVEQELTALYDGHLRPAVQAHPHFAERVLFAELVGLVRDLRDQAAPISGAALDRQERDYLQREAKHARLLVSKGLSLRIRNEFVGVELRDVFVPVTFEVEGGEAWVTTRGDDILRALKPGSAWLGSNLQNVLFEFGSDRPRPHRIRFNRMGRPEVFSYSMWTHLVSDEMVTGMKLMDRVYVDADKTSNHHVLSHYDHVLPSHLFSSQADTATLLDYNRVVVQGDPGSGKSTFAQFVHHAVATSDADAVGEGAAACVPIRARAAEFGEALQNAPSTRFESFLLDREVSYRPALERALLSGRALVVLDGLDEVTDPGVRQDVKRAVESFVADPLYAENRLVITSRVVGYQRDGQVGAFPHVTVQPFSDDQIRACVRAWSLSLSAANPDRDPDAHAQDLLDAIYGTTGVLRLARNPLLLTIIVLLHQQGRSLPDNRAHLYDVAVRTLLNTWPSAQRGVRLDEHFLREWLAPVAREIVAHGDAATISEAELKRLLVQSMLGLKAVTETEAMDETDRLLRDVEEHTGLLVPKGTDPDGREVYGFSHLTFAEYLAAYDLSRDLDDGTLDVPALARDPDRREILLLLAGLLGNESRRRAGALVQRLRQVDEASPADAFLHTGTRAAASVLADGVAALPDVVRQVCADLVRLFLQSPLPSLRQLVRSALEELATTEYAGALVRAALAEAEGPEHWLRLGHAIGAESFVDQLRPLLAGPGTDASDRDVEARRDQAAVLLLGIDPAADAHLRDLVRSARFDRRLLAAEALERRDPADARRLVETALADTADVDLVGPWLAFQRRYPRLVAARLLAVEHGDALEPDLVSWLIRNLHHVPDREDRAQVAARLVGECTEAADLVVTSLRDTDTSIDLGTTAVLLEHDAEPLRRAAAVAYLRSGVDRDSDTDEEAWKLVHEALASTDPREQLAAAGVLHDVDLGGVQEALDPLLRSDDLDLAARAAPFYPPGDSTARAGLWRAVESGSDVFQAGNVLWKTGGPEDVERLTRALRERAAGLSSPEVSTAKQAASALLVLIERGDPEALGTLSDALREATPEAVSNGTLVGIFEEVLSMPGVEGAASRFSDALDHDLLGPDVVAVYARSGNREARQIARSRADNLLESLSPDTAEHVPALDALFQLLTSEDGS